MAHFDIKIKHIAGKHLALIAYLSRNPVSKPESIENYEEEYVINCLIPQLEFINTNSSISESKKKGIRTDHSKEGEQITMQSQDDKQHKPKCERNKSNSRISLLLIQNTVNYAVQNIKSQDETKMDIKKVEQLELDDSFEETLTLINRWKDLAKPADYRVTNGT